MERKNSNILLNDCHVPYDHHDTINDSRTSDCHKVGYRSKMYLFRQHLFCGFQTMVPYYKRRKGNFANTERKMREKRYENSLID